uniref:Uncharacterized protein n=1 Tax=Rhodnius prolixus TaxID=13249 RepID=T1HIW7_RHOPR
MSSRFGRKWLCHKKEIGIFPLPANFIYIVPLFAGSGVCGDGHSCCGAKVEAELKKSATMALHTFLQNNFVSVRAMLASTAGALHVIVSPPDWGHPIYLYLSRIRKLTTNSASKMRI